MGQGSHPPLSWHDVLTQLGAVHGTYLTVFVMELAEFGSLEGAIRKGGLLFALRWLPWARTV